MAKYRVYNENIKAVGSAYINGLIFGLEFHSDSKLGKRYVKHMNKFLKEEKLKLVSAYFSGSKHAHAGLSQKRILPKQYKTYIKKRSSKTRKYELIERKFNNDTEQ